MNELQEQYLYLANHKIESADEMLDHHAQIKEKIADISAEQKMIYAENRKLGKLTEDEAEIIRQENTERLESDKRLKQREQEEQRTMKLLAYSRWHLDANDKFYEAVGLPSSAEYGKSRWADNIMIERWLE